MSWDEEAYRRRMRAACFVCETVAGNPDYHHHEAYRDEEAIVFLSRYPSLPGHLLVAPVAHRERVVDDFALDEYLRLQRLLWAAGRAVSATLPTERLYLFSLGSQQGNRHVHWHATALPPGVAYERQQFAAFAGEPLAVPDATMAQLAGDIGAYLRRELAGHGG